MLTLTLSLNTESEAFVREQLRIGAFNSAEAVVEASLSLLCQQQAKLEDLRVLMKTAQADMAQGRYTTCTTREELDALAQDILEKARLRAQR